MVGFLNCMQGLLDRTRVFDFLAPLALRLYLVPIFWMAGTRKWGSMENTIAVRWISVPLMVTMIVAAVSVHWQNGWLAIAEGSGLFATERTQGAIERLDRAKDVLQEHANYSWITENGSLVMLNNGIEFAATYFIMLLVLFFIGAGKYFSVDYWIARTWRKEGTC